MKRLMPLVAVGVVSLAALTGCGSVAQPAPDATTSAPPEVVTTPTWNNNNTDPYKGWAKKFPEDKAACILYRCDAKHTAYYVIWVGEASSSQVVPTSPDCPAK